MTADEADPNLANNISSETTTVDSCPLPTPVISAPVSVPSQTPGSSPRSPTIRVSCRPGRVDGGAITGRAVHGLDHLHLRRSRHHDERPGFRRAPGLRLGRCEPARVGRLPRRAAEPPVPRLRQHDPPPPDHRRLRGRDHLLPRQVQHARRDGRLPAEGRVRRGLRAPPAAERSSTTCTSATSRRWIEELHALGVTGGCTATSYCPDGPVSRGEMAVFLLKAKNGSGYAPNPCASVFADVPCPATPEFPFSDWIEQLYADGVTGGLPGGSAPLLSGSAQHARPDGGVPDEDLLVSIGTRRQSLVRPPRRESDQESDVGRAASAGRPGRAPTNERRSSCLARRDPALTASSSARSGGATLNAHSDIEKNASTERPRGFRTGRFPAAPSATVQFVPIQVQVQIVQALLVLSQPPRSASCSASSPH